MHGGSGNIFCPPRPCQSSAPHCQLRMASVMTASNNDSAAAAGPSKHHSRASHPDAAAAAAAAAVRRSRPCDACRRRKSKCVTEDGNSMCVLCKCTKANSAVRAVLETATDSLHQSTTKHAPTSKHRSHASVMPTPPAVAPPPQQTPRHLPSGAGRYCSSLVPESRSTTLCLGASCDALWACRTGTIVSILV